MFLLKENEISKLCVLAFDSLFLVVDHGVSEFNTKLDGGSFGLRVFLFHEKNHLRTSQFLALIS